MSIIALRMQENTSGLSINISSLPDIGVHIMCLQTHDSANKNYSVSTLIIFVNADLTEFYQFVWQGMLGAVRPDALISKFLSHTDSIPVL